MYYLYKLAGIKNVAGANLNAHIHTPTHSQEKSLRDVKNI